MTEAVRYDSGETASGTTDMASGDRSLERVARRSVVFYRNESLPATVPSYSSATYRQGTIGHSDSIISKFMMTTKDSEERFVADDKRPLVRSH